MVSLRAVFGIKLADIPPPFSPLIRTTQLTKTGNRVGFCWRAEENGAIRPVRSLDDDSAQLIADSLVKAGKEVYSLCPEGKDLYNHRPFNTPKGVIVRGLPDWRGTAELIASMDYVVTVDTAICHLAGLLRVPSLVVLPVNSDWKFQTEGKSQPWYGPQMEVFRNRDPFRWQVEEIIERVAEKLK
jgi:ADP-heptose:LPS heptosyltransferase